MKKLLTIALLLTVAAQASALDRSPRKKRRDKNKARTETPAPTPAPAVEKTVVPAPEPEPEPVEEPVVNDMTLGFTPEQTDSLLAAWRERQRQDAYSEFFKQYILEDSTEVVPFLPSFCA